MSDVFSFVRINMITRMSLKAQPGIGRLLDAFERSDRTCPTHWGLDDERRKHPYDHEQVVTTVTGIKTEVSMMSLWRKRPLEYESIFGAATIGMKRVAVAFEKNLHGEDLRGMFELASNLAEAVEPDFGCVQPIWLGSEKEEYASSAIRHMDFRKFGPGYVCARTWFGPYLVNLIRLEQLTTSGVPCQQTGWGGIRLDLVPEPWTADPQALRDSQSKVMAHLLPSCVFGDYSTKRAIGRAGPNWKPPDDGVVRRQAAETRQGAQPGTSADDLYQEARARWAKAVDIGVHDDEKVIYGVTPILEKALRENPKHVKSLALLSDLLMAVGADEEASQLLARLLELEPDAKPHQEKMALLRQKRSKERSDEIRHYLSMKWLTTENW